MQRRARAVAACIRTHSIGGGAVCVGAAMGDAVGSFEDGSESCGAGRRQGMQGQRHKRDTGRGGIVFMAVRPVVSVSSSPLVSVQRRVVRVRR